MKIEPEPVDIFRMKSNKVKSPPKINKKLNMRQEEQKLPDYEDYSDQMQYRAPLGPPKEWDRV